MKHNILTAILASPLASEFQKVVSVQAGYLFAIAVKGLRKLEVTRLTLRVRRNCE